MKTLAVANQKGGCGKTTTAVNLAASLAVKGKRVLIVDLDAQAHTTLAYGLVPDSINRTIHEVLQSNMIGISHVILPTKLENLDIVPSNILLSGIEEHLHNRRGREYILKEKLKWVINRYDYCVIDCSPSLSLLTLNALVACDEVIIPVQTHYYALEGMKQLLESIDVVRQRFNSNITIAGILLTFYEKRTLLSRDVFKQMKEHFGNLLFSTLISRTVRLAEAPSAGEPVITYDKYSRGAIQYMNLADEISDETQSGFTKENIINF